MYLFKYFDHPVQFLIISIFSFVFYSLGFFTNILKLFFNILHNLNANNKTYLLILVTVPGHPHTYFLYPIYIFQPSWRLQVVRYVLSSTDFKPIKGTDLWLHLCCPVSEQALSYGKPSSRISTKCLRTTLTNLENMGHDMMLQDHAFV
jgi:hypothetical protein